MTTVAIGVDRSQDPEGGVHLSDERFRLLARATNDTIRDHDVQTGSMWWNENFTTSFGYAPSEIGEGIESWLSRIHPEDLPRIKASLSASIDGGEPTWRDEYRFRRKNGTFAYVLDRGFLIRDASGKTSRIVASMMDITESKRNEEELRENRAALAKAQELAHLGSWTWDLAKGDVEWSDELCRIHALPLGTRTDFDGLVVHAHPEDRGTLRDAIVKLRTDPGSVDVTYRIVRHDGSRRVLQLRADAMKEVFGFPARIVATCLDVTESLEAQESLRERAEELARLTDALSRMNRELDQFAYVTSHDLKAPLRGIANLARWIEEDAGEALPAEARDHLELLVGRVNRMESLIDAILHYSRAGRVRAKPERVEVQTLLAEIVDLLAPPPGYRIEIAPGMPAMVTERARLQQVFMNLISNAVKHHHNAPSGTIRVGVEDAGRWWRFSVSDDGPGIAPRYHEKIFAIFQTLEARDKVEGTGIGLALVKKIVESFGGTISVESDVGKGATFRFTWPKGSP